jgi:hypothetical protein
VAGFFGDTRAGAVGISAVLITLMCFGGTAFVSDHVVLLHHRNILQAAATSASIAATQHMAKLDTGLTDKELAAALEPLARRYVLANLPAGTREAVRDSLEVTLTPDREAGVVGVEVAAPLGGAIVGRHIWGRLVEKTVASSGAERIVAPVDLVLAIDVTGSMDSSIYTKGAFLEEDRRINVVRNAAQLLIKALYDQGGGDTGHVSVGLVPFNTTVNVGASRQDWVSDLGQGHKVIPPGFGPWRGCIEHRVPVVDPDLSVVDPVVDPDTLLVDPDLSLVTPAVAPFTSWFAPSTLEFRAEERAALAAEIGAAVNGENDWSADNAHEDYSGSPHSGCPRDEIVPLTNVRETVELAITNLQPWAGGGTMTHLGVVWGRRLLASEWRDTWGLPEQATELGKQKVLVLLTDGINDAYDSRQTYPGNYRHGSVSRTEYSSQYTGYGRAGTGSVEEGYRAGTRLTGLTQDSEDRDILNTILLTACELAKGDGVTVFTVSAVPDGHPREKELSDRLVTCATSEDHAFVENSEPELMKTAFQEIGRMVQGIRRTRTVVTD